MKKRIMIRNVFVWGVAFFFIQFFGCSSISKLFRSSGKIQMAMVKTGSPKTITIGAIENRDFRYSPHLIKNFHDMLQFQLISLGFQVSELDGSFADSKQNMADQASINNIESEENKADKQEKSQIDPAKNQVDKTASVADLLPDNLKTIAGEHNEKSMSGHIPELKMLAQDEIQKLSKQKKFDYFIQGAMGNNESGTLLSTDDNSLIFLKIYDTGGIMIGALNFTVNGRTLLDAPFLKDVCYRISENISQKMK